MSKSPQLYEQFEWLKSTPGNRFEIYDVTKNKIIEKCASYLDLTKNGNTLEGYFTDLVEKGIDTVQIVRKKKNGSTYVRDGGCGINYNLSTEAKPNVAASGSQDFPGATPQLPLSPEGLMGAASSLGLGFPDLMSMNSRAEKYDESRTLVDKLTDKVDELQKDNNRLDKENIQLNNDLKREKEKREEALQKEPSKMDKFLDKLFENPEAIPHIAAAVTGKPAANPGLNAPQHKQVSETKSTVIDTIANPQITDKDVEASYYVLVQAASKNEKFMQKYYQLLTDFNLINNGSDNTSNG